MHFELNIETENRGQGNQAIEQARPVDLNRRLPQGVCVRKRRRGSFYQPRMSLEDFPGYFAIHALSSSRSVGTSLNM